MVTPRSFLKIEEYGLIPSKSGEEYGSSNLENERVARDDSTSSDQNVMHDTVLGGRVGSNSILGYSPGDLNLDWYTLYDHAPVSGLPMNDNDYLLSVTLAGQPGAHILGNPDVQ